MTWLRQCGPLSIPAVLPCEARARAQPRSTRKSKQSQPKSSKEENTASQQTVKACPTGMQFGEATTGHPAATEVRQPPHDIKDVARGKANVPQNKNGQPHVGDSGVRLHKNSTIQQCGVVSSAAEEAKTFWRS